MDDEKHISPTAEEKAYGSSSGDAPPYDGHKIQGGDIRLKEAADIYGDVAAAEEYGYVTRG